MLSVLYCVVFLVFTLVYFVPFSVLFFVTWPFDRERVALHWASRVWAKAIFRLCPTWKTEVTGLEHIDKSKPYVIVTNHQAMLDVPMMYVLPLNFRWVAKKEVLRMPIFGWVLWMHGDVAIERGSALSAKRMMSECSKHLAQGISVIIFPEGTRTKDGRIGRFKEGAFLLAKNNGVSILPVVAEGTGSLMNGWKMKLFHRFTVRVLEPIDACQVEQMEVKELTRTVEQRMVEQHKRMRADLYS